MKKLFFSLSIVFILLSIISFLYGSMKLAENNTTITSPIPGVEVKKSTSSKELGKKAIGFSLIPLVAGVVGILLSSRKKIEL